MHIAMIGQKGMPAIYGGVEQHVHELATGLVRHGYEVIVYARSWYTGGRATMYDGVRIEHVLTVKSKYFDTLIHTFLSTIHALVHGYDVIHYHGVGPSLLSFLPRILRPKTRVIVTFHSIDRYHQKWGWFARAVLKFGEWTAVTFPHETIVISRGIAQYCTNEFKKNLVYIPYGISEYALAPTRDALMPYGLHTTRYLAMVSRLLPHKGAHLLIAAFRTLKETYPHDPLIAELHLVIVGGSVYTDSYVKKLHALADKCPDIHFTGFASGKTLDALYTHADALVHPSLNEGLPMTVLKAMQSGTPVLLSNIPEHKELIQDERCLFQSNDEASLVKAIYHFLHMHTEERRRIAETNKKKVMDDYGWEMLLSKIMAVYERRESAPLRPVNTRI